MSQANTGWVQVGAVLVAAILWLGSTTAVAVPALTGVVTVGIPVLSLLAAFHALFHEHAGPLVLRLVVAVLVGGGVASLVALYFEQTTLVNAVNLLLVVGLVALAVLVRRAD